MVFVLQEELAKKYPNLKKYGSKAFEAPDFKMDWYGLKYGLGTSLHPDGIHVWIVELDGGQAWEYKLARIYQDLEAWIHGLQEQENIRLAHALDKVCHCVTHKMKSDKEWNGERIQYNGMSYRWSTCRVPKFSTTPYRQYFTEEDYEKEGF